MERNRKSLKVLVISTVGLNYEGITAVISNYSQKMDREKVELTFTAFEDIPDGLRDRFEKIGKIVIMPARQKQVRGYVASLMKHLRSVPYDAVHIHGNSGTMAIESVLAKLAGVKNVLVHCHNTTCDRPELNKILVPIMKATTNHLLACSVESGKWLYGNSGYTVLNNAIDTFRFRFDMQCRQRVRQSLEYEDCFVIGHIGHFTEQKNHTFLIDVFAELYKIMPDARLLLIGDGPNAQQIREKVRMLNLQDAVKFLGRRDDVNDLYQAMDILLLPSKWEGLPVTMLEAQANGLPLLVSDVITAEANCTDRVCYQSLEDAPEEWAKTVVSIREKGYSRVDDMQQAMQSSGFSIHTQVDDLMNLYEPGRAKK